MSRVGIERNPGLLHLSKEISDELAAQRSHESDAVQVGHLDRNPAAQIGDMMRRVGRAVAAEVPERTDTLRSRDPRLLFVGRSEAVATW